MIQETLFKLKIPSMPVLDVSRCHVKQINYQTASNMVNTCHYAHRTPSISFAYGLYVDDTLAGCITYGMPAAQLGRKAVCGKEYQDIVYELNRLYVHDWAGRNSESWLIGQSFKLLPKPLILVSYADKGQDHVGYIYQATNWLYCGTTKPGGFSDVELEGIKYSRKRFYDLLGSQAKMTILEHYPSAIFHDETQKHRYVYFLGSKTQKKEMKKSLKWKVQNYPKL